MIKFRNVATAFLKNDDDFLLQERVKINNSLPRYWYGVGGHLEQFELNDPRHAILREINEETGLKENEIENLKLKYILMRRQANETVINFVYFGNTTTKNVVENDEGELYWVPQSEVLNDNHFFADILRLTLSHYFETGKNSNEVLVGVLNKDESANIKWSILGDMQ